VDTSAITHFRKLIDDSESRLENIIRSYSSSSSSSSSWCQDQARHTKDETLVSSLKSYRSQDL
jgi:hypothetical protein